MKIQDLTSSEEIDMSAVRGGQAMVDLGDLPSRPHVLPHRNGQGVWPGRPDYGGGIYSSSLLTAPDIHAL